MWRRVEEQIVTDISEKHALGSKLFLNIGRFVTIYTASYFKTFHYVPTSLWESQVSYS